jgi:Fic family protein
MDSINNKLDEISSLKNELDGLRPFTPEQINNLKKLFDVEFTYNSTAIEGNTFTYQETKVVLLDGVTIGGKPVREYLEIINHKEAIDYIGELAQRKRSELRRTDIFNIHSIILRGIDPKNAGTFRTVPVYVFQQNGSKHIFCDPLLITDEMDAFFNWLFTESGEHPAIVAAEAHTRLVSIHPFVDGNGRSARLLMNLVLLQNGYVPAIIKNADRAKYLDALEQWQNNNNKDDFYYMVIESERESLEIYIKTIKEKIVWK